MAKAPQADAQTRAGIKRQIKLPNREAFKIALRSVKIRFWRSCVTVAGIVLTIAFLSSVLTGGVIGKYVQDPAAQQALHDPKNQATQVWLMSISLLVCAVGITNAMLMSVTERYREIGTMKCLGALDWFVVKIFLIEAAVLGLIGSFIGAIIGFFMSLLAWTMQYSNVLGSIHWGEAFLAILISIAVGAALSVMGAIYPARRAGKMPPADAMRTEI